MLLLGALLVASCCIVSFGSNAKADDKAGRLLSKASSWITSNTPAQWWNVQEVELVAKEVVPNEDYMEEDEGYFVDEINVIIQTMEEDDSITQNGAGRKTKLPESKPTKAHPQPTQEGQSNVQVVDKEIVSKLRESYMKNMREEDPNVMTVSDLTFRPNSVGPHFEKNRTQIGVENATLYMLVRNSELDQTLKTMREIEDRFNREYRYPWTFLNDVLFTEEFKVLTTGMASGKVEYGLVPKEFWSLPDFIDEDKFEEAVEDYTERNVIYGASKSYRHMCRFNSGFFFLQELMLQYKYYWRVEPGTRFYCDQRYDPFTFMRENDKKYGFVIAIPEYEETIPTLWQTVEEFYHENPEYIAPDSAQQFLTDKNHARPDDVLMPSNTSYNLCHFWSNFEIADLDFFRSKPYMDYFNYLDQKGGFFYERWGDAPVHTIGAVMMLNKSQIHHFSDIGYKHMPYYRCPHDEESYTSGRCYCDDEKPKENIDFIMFSCLPKWWIHGGRHFLYKYNDQLILM